MGEGRMKGKLIRNIVLILAVILFNVNMNTVVMAETLSDNTVSEVEQMGVYDAVISEEMDESDCKETIIYELEGKMYEETYQNEDVKNAVISKIVDYADQNLKEFDTTYKDSSNVNRYQCMAYCQYIWKGVFGFDYGNTEKYSKNPAKAYTYYTYTTDKAFVEFLNANATPGDMLYGKYNDKQHNVILLDWNEEGYWISDGYSSGTMWHNNQFISYSSSEFTSYFNKDGIYKLYHINEDVYRAASGMSDEEIQRRESIKAFVSRMYTVALGREAEVEGHKEWSNQLLEHKIDGAGIARGFICSGEFKNKNLNNEEYVNTLYRTFFNREPDAGGKKDWLSKMSKGMSRENVLAGFVNSQEFGNLCTSYGIDRGTMEADGSSIYNPGIRGFVQRLYTKCLKRDGEMNGIEDWSHRINTKAMKAVDAAKSFFHSQEFANKNLDDRSYVETLYQTFMDREPDSAGMAYWLNMLSNGMSRDEVLMGFANSREFDNIMASYGILSQDWIDGLYNRLVAGDWKSISEEFKDIDSLSAKLKSVPYIEPMSDGYLLYILTTSGNKKVGIVLEDCRTSLFPHDYYTCVFICNHSKEGYVNWNGGNFVAPLLETGDLWVDVNSFWDEPCITYGNGNASYSNYDFSNDTYLEDKLKIYDYGHYVNTCFIST